MINERFVLESRLDQGRFGTVYRALDTKQASGGHARAVALWLLPPEFSRNKPAMELFKRDFLRVSEFIHPAVARVYELDHDGETYFVTSELLDGETLRNVLDHLRPENLDADEADAIVREVGDALAEAHDLGIVHADVRPENVLVTTEHEVKLLNFMSTSLMRNAPFATGPAGDVRDLAALAYELYTGAPALRDGRPRRRVKGVPKRRSKAIDRALAEPPAGPYASVREFLLDAGLATARRPYLRVAPHAASRRAGQRSFARRIAIPAAGLAALAVGVYSGGNLGSLLEAVQLEAWVGSVPAALDAARAPDVATLEGRPAAPAGADRSMRFVAPEGADAKTAPPRGAPQSAPPRSETDPSAASAGGAAVPQEPDAASSEPESSVASSEAGSDLGSSGARARLASPEAAADVAAPAPVTLSLSTAALTAFEGQTALTIDIVRTGDSAGPAEIVWWTADGTARAGDDYASFGRRVESFAPGETVRTLHIPITSDARRESDEHFFVHLDPSSPYTRERSTTSATVTLIDDDR